ncbi:hypothetical protein QRO08_09780 [Paracidovorax citrulli]|uniref:Uncharacterized protein n=2 Tax=Paracidovorax citrulli TaxID=80869 RepID=A1TPQ3_PARC0|nr:hypothetical protein [Paracidovorax citrulli]ABM32941.1 hypothetical protein Aave_2366 [Paracidovorax citrulli AAC00-1]ATG93090.1 hypothetical protein CQB05_02715 [Paracidovorax citrulli]MVT36777.1 hypothetical protein [Paracidovorax citrulli]PVY67161.1 hypothetical protein C8E08_4596 [Paracidovorax citrulli]REG68676.1 hypothetical protein C8E07_1795 [Paracidovorax citrulli]
MPFANKSPQLAGYDNAITPGGPELVVSRCGQQLVAADHVAGTVGIIGVLPAGTLPVHLYVRAPAALGAGFTASIGIANAAGTDFSTAAEDGGAVWVVDNNTGAAGGYVQLTPAAFAKVAPKDYDRRVLLKITGVGTGTPAGLLAVDLVYANA